MGTNKQHIKQCIHDGLGWDDAVIQDVKQIKGGYLSNAYIATVTHEGQTKQIFIKEQNENSWGAERSSDPFATYVTSDLAAAEMSKTSPRVLGTFVATDDTTLPVRQVTDGKLFQVQECVVGDNLYDLCKPKVEKVVQGREVEIGEKVAEIFADIHSHKHPIERGTKFDEYSRSLRDVIAHPELTLNIFQNFLKDSKVLTGDFRYAYLAEMIKVAEYFSQFTERNALIHGDAWHANLLLNGGDLYIIDYSRLVHGEPGIDVGHFYVVCLQLALTQQNDFHVRMAQSFLSKYIELTGDEFIKESMVTYIGFTGAVSVVEDFYPEIADEDRQKLISYVYKSMQNKKMKEVSTWKEIGE
jgi:thiamine kinase-like enzyme